VEALKKEKEELMGKSEAEIRDEILNSLEIHDPTKYRPKIKGYVVPFNTHEKASNMPAVRKSGGGIGAQKVTSSMSRDQSLSTQEARLRKIQERRQKGIDDKIKSDKEREDLRKMH
jgi:hypothetical protein